MLNYNHYNKYNFTVEKPSLVLVKVVNIIGIEIATLVNEKHLPGNYEVKFDGSTCPAGIYYIKLFSDAPSENGHETVSLPDYPGKKFCLLETKEILVI
jgi:hypothetical protein